MGKNLILKSVVIGLLAILPAFFVQDMVVDNWRVRNLGVDFDQLQHPPNSRLIQREGATGLLVGNSNHCDFFVGELRTYTGPAAKIQSFYAQQALKHPNLLPIDVEFVEGQRQPDSIVDYVSKQSYDGHWSGESISKDKLYIVYYLYVGSLNAGCDIRCW